MADAVLVEVFLDACDKVLHKVDGVALVRRQVGVALHVEEEVPIEQVS